MAINFGSIGSAAGAGAAIGGPVGAGIGAGIGLIGSIFGGNAAQDAAEQQLAMQQQQQQMIMGMLPALKGIAAPTAGELDNLELQLSGMQRMHQMQFAQLQHDQEQYMANPAAAEANAMMNGKDAAVLGPLKQQIENQRQQLIQQLTQQYGPGFANTTAGMQAMTQFEQSANMQMQQAQQSSIGQMSGIALASQQGNMGTMATAMGSMSQGAGTYSSMSDALKARQMQPYGMAMNGIMGTNPTQYAGANDVAAMTMGRNLSDMGSTFMGYNMLGMLRGGGNGGSGGGGSVPNMGSLPNPSMGSFFGGANPYSSPSPTMGDYPAPFRAAA